jgi:hypothetical protein
MAFPASSWYRRSMRSLALVVLLALPSSAFAGWSATQLSTTGQGSQSSEAKLFYDSSRLRIDAGSKTYVLEFGPDRFLFIDHQAKRYASATLDDVIALQNQILGDMKKSIAQLPSPQREIAQAQIEKLEKGAKARATPDVKRTGKKQTVNGYACEMVTWSDEFGQNEACIAAKMPVDVSVFLKESARLSERLAEKGASNATPTQALFQLPGFPVRTKRTESVGPTQLISTTEIKNVKAFKASGDTFAAPKTYQKGTLSSIVAPGM